MKPPAASHFARDVRMLRELRGYGILPGLQALDSHHIQRLHEGKEPSQNDERDEINGKRGMPSKNQELASRKRQQRLPQCFHRNAYALHGYSQTACITLADHTDAARVHESDAGAEKDSCRKDHLELADEHR